MTQGRSAAGARPAPAAAMMLARAFLCQNVAIGSSFGGFSVAALPLQEKFHSTRGATSLGLALVVLAFGVVGPMVATMLTRIGLRKTMTIGVVLSGLGYVLLAYAPNMPVALAAFALLIGPGVAMFGPFSSSLLAANWYPHGHGKAVGIANMPLFVALAPLLGVAVIERYGVSAFFLCLAAVHVVLLPVALTVSDPPATVAVADGDGHARGPVAAVLSARDLLIRPIFWLVVLGGGVLSASGIIGVSHVVALAIEKGVRPTDAALLVSVMGGASVVGSLLVGVICDRLGGARALAIAALGLAASWLLLFSTGWLPPMMAAMMLAGACGAGIYPCVIVLSADVFGASSLPRAMALFGIFTLPLTFLLPPGAGVLRDLAGNYAPMMLALIGGCGAIAVIFFFIGRSAPQAAIAATGSAP